MLTILTNANDCWQVFLKENVLGYKYMATGVPMSGITDYKAVIDSKGYLHIIVSLKSGIQVYARWVGSFWERFELPVHGKALSFHLDVYNLPHFLLYVSEIKNTIHVQKKGKQWIHQRLPFTISSPPLLVQSCDHGKFLLINENFMDEKKRLYISVYSPADGWCLPHKLAGEYPPGNIYCYCNNDLLLFLFFYGKDEKYLVQMNLFVPEKNTYHSLPLGYCDGFPDEKPVLLIKKDVFFFVWTSNGRLSFIFSQDGGRSWLPPQTTYIFFPARIETLETQMGISNNMIAFTKVSGLEPQWPLLIDFETLFSLCRAIIAYPKESTTTIL